MRFMRQSQMENGWVLNFAYLNHVQSAIDDETGYVELETIEAVLLAAEKVEAQTQQATAPCSEGADAPHGENATSA